MLWETVGSRRGCPHHYLELPWYEGCDGSRAACRTCWERPAAEWV